MKKSTILLPLILIACTTNPKVPAVARPLAVIQTNSTQTVINKLSEICDMQGWQIDKSDTSSLVCSKEAPLMGQLFLGTKYGTAVRSHMQFNAFSVQKNKIKVVARAWSGNQTALGQEKTMEFDTLETRQLLQSFLNQAQTQIEHK